jgi:thymidine kinase
MFLEHPKQHFPNKGWIEVICGSMFSGKTEELIRRLKRAQFARQRVEIFKPQVDTRYDEVKIVSHDSNSIISTVVPAASNILLLSGDVDVIGIDEAQFFDDELPSVCETLANKGVRIIIAGLDMDYRGRPFGPIPHLLSIAEFVTKVHAICMDCGNLANHSYRTNSNREQVMLGEKDEYLPLCRSCFAEKMSTEKITSE